jgi:hypothetical protein
MTELPLRFTDEVLSDEMAAVLRSKSPAERLQIADRLWRSSRRMIRASLARQHPDWSQEELDRATAWRMSRGTETANGEIEIHERLRASIQSLGEEIDVEADRPE